MAALAPRVSSWIPEDDLLLKNAIEAGASLESLAKGAAQFSREFTVISEEDSSRVIEFEPSASTLSAGNLKDNNSLSGKRGVHSCYYAKRRRIQNEPFNSMDLSALVATDGSNFVGLEDKPLPRNPISDDLVVEETNVNVVDRSFPQIQESSRVLGENQFLLESEEFPLDSLFEDNDSILKPSSSSDQINNDPESVFSEFEGNQVLNSPIFDWDWSIWRTDDGLSESAIPSGDGGHGENGQHGGDNVSGHNAVFTDSDVAPGHNSLMIDEPFFLDIDDVKYVLDKSFFDSLSLLLASSPKATDRDQMIEATTTKTQDNLAKVSCSGLEESDGLCIPKASDRDQLTEVTTIKTQEVSCSGFEESDGPCIPKASDQEQIIESVTIETQDTLAKVSCLDLGECTLNSEEPEIPCNEDVVLPEIVCLKDGEGSIHGTDKRRKKRSG